MIDNQDELERSFSELGYVKLCLTSSLYKTVCDLYLDCILYALILVNDASLDVNKKLLKYINEQVMNRSLTVELDRCFQMLLLEIAKLDRKLLGKLYDFGTRPMKFLSGSKVFFDDYIQFVIRAFFTTNPQNLFARPLNGETLHIFPPGSDNFKYNLPIHQDFPYLMQSPRQLTFWLNLTNNKDCKAGGIRIYPSTHKYGISYTKRDKRGNYEVMTELYKKFNAHNYIDSENHQFELYAIDSLCWHLSLRNTSQSSVRVTYIFRVSDIGDSTRVKFGLDALHPDCLSFDQYFPEYFCQ